MTTVALQRELQHQVTALYDMEDDDLLRKAVASLKRVISKAFEKKEPQLDQATRDAIEQGHREYEEGKCIRITSEEELHDFLEGIKISARKYV